MVHLLSAVIFHASIIKKVMSPLCPHSSKKYEKFFQVLERLKPFQRRIASTTCVPSQAQFFSNFHKAET